MPPTREEILEENRRLRAEYGELFDSVAALLFQHDPVGINSEDNPDEQETETWVPVFRLMRDDVNFMTRVWCASRGREPRSQEIGYEGSDIILGVNQ